MNFLVRICLFNIAPHNPTCSLLFEQWDLRGRVVTVFDFQSLALHRRVFEIHWHVVLCHARKLSSWLRECRWFYQGARPYPGLTYSHETHAQISLNKGRISTFYFKLNIFRACQMFYRLRTARFNYLAPHMDVSPTPISRHLLDIGLRRHCLSYYHQLRTVTVGFSAHTICSSILYYHI